MCNYRDQLRADIQPSYTDSLLHYGVKGMKWGIKSRFREAASVLQNTPVEYNDPRQTSNIPDDGREVSNFKDLWYDSSNYIVRKGLKVYKDESGEAYIKDNGKIYRGKNAFQALRRHKLDKLKRRRAMRQN